MSFKNRIRTLAVSALLASSPALPVLAEAPQPQASLEQMFAQIEARPSAPSAAFDIDSLNAAFGGAANLTFGAMTTDPATGAVRLTDLRAEVLGEKPFTLFTADEMLVWNADTKALTDRVAGQRLGETLRLFDRIELAGLKMDISGYTDAVTTAVNSAVPDDSGASITYEKADVDVGRLVFTGFTLHPWTFQEVEGEDEGLAAIRLISAFARSFSLDNMAMFDTVMTQEYTESGAAGSMVTTYGRSLIQGYDRGDLAATITGSTDFAGTFSVPANELYPTGDTDVPPVPMAMSGSTGYGAWNGLKLAKLFEYGERGELPPISEKDLWSLGSYVIEDMEFAFNDKSIMSIGELEFSADEFAWFLPERINIRHVDASLDLSGMMQWVADIAPEAAAESEDGEPSLLQIIDIMDRSGLGKFSGSGNLALTWDSDTGATLLQGTSVTDGLYTDDTRVALSLPSYASLVPAFGVDGKSPDSDLLREAMNAGFSFSGGHYSLTDTGLLNSIAALVIEIAKISGDEDPMLSNFADATPDTVRMFASGLVMMGSGAVTQELPQAQPWIASLSKFITSGGTLAVRLEPEKALTTADFAGAGADAGMVESPSPAELVDLFGLSVTHTPAPESAAGTP
ncbi:MAG: hypothetical protein RLO80_06860 [Hyphomonas sp.]